MKLLLGKKYSLTPNALFYICIFIYFVTRLWNLTILPIFNDESIYIRYGLHQIMEKDHAPYSLLIGKEPLLPFLYAFVGHSIGDLLLGARLVTVLFGFLTFVGLYLLTKKLLNNNIALLVAFLYSISPYTLFFDRLALMDSAIHTVSIWVLFFTYRYIEKPTGKTAIILGIIMSVGLWIKASSFFYVLLPGIGVCFYTYAEWHNSKNRKIFPTYKLTPLAISYVIIFISYIPLVSNHFYTEYWQQLQEYTYPFFSIFMFPVGVWFKNLVNIFSWLFFYLTPTIFIAAIIGLYQSRKKQGFFLIFVWLLGPFIYEVLFARMFTSRYSLMLTGPLLFFAAITIMELFKKQKLVTCIIVAILAFWCLFYDVILVTNPLNYPSLFPSNVKDDLLVYTHGFSSGYGVKQAISYLENLAKDNEIVVITRNDHGNPEDAVVAYLLYKKMIKLYLIVSLEQIQNIQEKETRPIYFVSRGSYAFGLERSSIESKIFQKPVDTEFVGVYRLQ